METCAKLNDESVLVLKDCKNLKRLSIVYCRYFGEDVLNIIALCFPKLEYLNLRDCVIQADFGIFQDTVKNLREVNISGDSWCKCESIFGLSKLEGLEVLHLGTFLFLDL